MHDVKPASTCGEILLVCAGISRQHTTSESFPYSTSLDHGHQMDEYPNDSTRPLTHVWTNPLCFRCYSSTLTHHLLAPRTQHVPTSRLGKTFPQNGCLPNNTLYGIYGRRPLWEHQPDRRPMTAARPGASMAMLVPERPRHRPCKMPPK